MEQFKVYLQPISQYRKNWENHLSPWDGCITTTEATEPDESFCRMATMMNLVCKVVEVKKNNLEAGIRDNWTSCSSKVFAER